MKEIKQTYLFINGEPPVVYPEISSEDLVVCTDGAYHYLVENQITPHYICGDFDSILEIPENSTSQIVHLPDQDFTDFEKTLQFLIERNIREVEVYGSTMRHQDHFLGNLHSALRFQNQISIRFHDTFQYFFLAKKHTFIKEVKGKIISLFPFPLAQNITLKGFEYPLNNEDLELGVRIGTRNKAVMDTIEIIFESGNLFVFVEY